MTRPRAPERCRIATALAIALLGALHAPAAQALGAGAAETWRSTLDPAHTWHWDTEALQGPENHRCRQPRHELRPRDATGAPVVEQRIVCDGLEITLRAGADGRTVLGGLGGLQEPVQRVQVAAGPLAAVHELLRAHLGTTMGYSAERVHHVERWMTRSLRGRLLQHLARPRRGLVPSVPFDPWTGADEVPERLWLEPAAVAGDAALVPMHAALTGIGRADHRVTYALRRENGRWLVDDIRYLDGDVTLRTLLAR